MTVAFALLRFAATIVLIFSHLACSAAGSTVEERNRTIILAQNAWTASYLNVEIAKQLIRANFPHIQVQVKNYGSSLDTFVYLFRNPEEPIVVLEAWPTSVNNFLDSVRKTSRDIQDVLGFKDFEELGTLGVVGQTGWFIPDYVAEEHPEALSWEFYQDPDKVQLFATPETLPKGRFLTGDPSWAAFDEPLIANLDLHLEIVYAGNESAQIAILDEATRKKEPVLMYWWIPTAVAGHYNLKRVKLPALTDECRALLQRELSLYSCDYFPENIIKLATVSVNQTVPELYPFFKAFTITNDDQLSLLPRIAFGGESLEGVAADWIDENRDKWERWLEGDNGMSGSGGGETSSGATYSLRYSLSLLMSAASVLLLH